MCVSLRDIGLKIANVRLIDTPMGEASVVSSLVNDHRVLHVVPSVADNSDDGIRTRRAQVEIILQVLSRTNQGRLREKKPVDLVVHAIRVGVVGCAHCLFGHLALVHVTRALIVVAEGDG